MRALACCAAAVFIFFGISAKAEAADRPRPVDAVKLGPPPVETTTNKIVGGEPADPGKFPFQVALIRSDTPEGQEQRGQFCGAALIGDGWIITAAHCVPQTTPEEVDVYVGSTILPTGSGSAGGSLGIRRSLSRIQSHEGFNPATLDNDLALLKLAEPVPDQLLPSLLPTAQNESLYATGGKATVIGWGRTQEGGSTTPRLRQVEVTLQDQALCETNYDTFFNALPGAGDATITVNMFCAGEATGGSDSCQGDSGGFIGAQGEGGRWVQLGVVSWGIGCARPGLFGVYTRIVNYADWIREIKQNF
jgi:secreted trypsin-like serine protease